MMRSDTQKQPFQVIYGQIQDKRQPDDHHYSENNGKPKTFEYQDLSGSDACQYTIFEKYCNQAINAQSFKGEKIEAAHFYFQLMRKLELSIIKNKIELEASKEFVEQSKAYFERKERQMMPKQQSQGQKQREGVQIKKLEKSATVRTKKEPPYQKSSCKSDNNRSQTDSIAYQCKIRACNKIFDKRENLSLHQMLKHNNPPHQLNKNKIFTIEIKDFTDLGLSKRLK